METSTTKPALGAAGGELYVAWADSENQLNVMPALKGGEGKVPLGETSVDGPALASLNGELYIAWTGTDPESRLNVMPVFGGETRKQTLDQTSIAGPALYVRHDELHIAWTGTDGNGRLNTMPVSDPGRKFILPPDITSAHGPSVGRGTQGDSYIVWTRKDQGIAYFPLDGDPSVLRGHLSKNTSIAGPAFSDNGFIAWAGTDGSHKLNSLPLRGNESQHRVIGDTSAFAPALWVKPTLASCTSRGPELTATER